MLCVFTTMHVDLRAKRSQFTHSEVPAELLVNSFANDMDNEREKDGKKNEPKRQKKKTRTTGIQS